MADSCPGADGLVCVDGWLYSQVRMMIFPANKRCPTCSASALCRRSDAPPEEEETKDG